MNIVRGDTFELAVVVKVDGVPADITAWQITSSVATDFGIIAPLTVAVTNALVGEFSLSAATDEWPLGCCSFDIRYVTDSAQIVTTAKTEVHVTKSDTP